MAFDQDKRRQTYVLPFGERTGLAGLEVATRKPGFKALRKLASAVLVLGDDFEGPGVTALDKLEAEADLFTALRMSTVSWNLVDRQRPIPLADMLTQDRELLLTIARAWYRIVVQRDELAADEETEDELDDPQAVDDDVDNSVPVIIPGLDPDVDEEWLAQLPTQGMPDHLPPDPTEQPTAEEYPEIGTEPVDVSAV